MNNITATRELKIRPMSGTELDTLVDGAAAEAWNPGLHDCSQVIYRGWNRYGRV